MSEIDKDVMDDDNDGLEGLDIGLDGAGHAGRATWRALFNFTSSLHTLPLSLALVFSIASGVIVPAMAVFLGKIFDQFSSYGAGQVDGHHFVGKVAYYSLILCGLGGASGILNGIFYGSWLVFGEFQARNAREQLFGDMLDKEMEWYDMRKPGIETLVSRLQSQIRDLQMATSQPLGFAIQCSVTALVSLGLSFYYAWSLTLVTLALLPVSAVVLAWISAVAQPSVDGHTQALTKASKLAAYAISAIDAVKCLNGQDHEIWQYSNAARNAAGFFLAQARANAAQIGLVRFMTLGMFVQGFWYGSHLVHTGKKSTGDIVTAFMSALGAAQSIEQILPQLIILEKGRAAGATLRATQAQIERGRKIGKMLGSQKPSDCDGALELRNVSFSYPSRPDRFALHNVNLSFPAGETTFVVGMSGSGKSTLGNLLLGLYRPVTGNVLVDGHPIQVLDMDWLRKQITLCQQQNVLFNETIFKNIAFGRQDHQDVKKADVKGSVKLALLESVIQNLPYGLDTFVGAGGTTLSGGQKQRVAIARTRLRDAPILILDEATSALDHMTKIMVIEAIREWRRGKTTIIITHDMEQILDQDYVYILEQGRVVNCGFGHALRKIPTCFLASPSPRAIEFPRRSKRSSIAAGDGARYSETKSARPKNGPASFTDSQIQPKRKGRFIPSVFFKGKEATSPRLELGSLLSPLSPAASSPHRQHRASPTFQYARRRSEEDSNIIEMFEYKAQTAGTDKLVGRTHSKMPKEVEELRSPRSRLWEQRLSTVSTVVAQVTHQARALGEEKRQQVNSIKDILSTVWPSLTLMERTILLTGFASASVHAAATPVFSWAFARLLGSIVVQREGNGSGEARKWSLVVLAITVTDAAASYLMHYLLEHCGQAWVDSIRIEAFRRVLDQPRAWFDSDQNNVSRLMECLDRHAEEMRNLLGRFAGLVYVGVVMMVVSVVWSLILCWKFTLIGLASAPAIYAITRSFEVVSGNWEGRSSEAAERVSDVFNETFSNIRTVRILTLERCFHNKCVRAAKRGFHIGLKRSAYTGFFFGLSDSANLFVTALILWYGAHLASSQPSILQDILTALTMLLFGISNANAIVAFVPQINSSRATASQLLRLSRLPRGKSHEHTGHSRLAHPGHISFSNVSLTYPTRPTFPALTSLSLDLLPGRTTALVGTSGCGKSSLASILLGLYPPSSGTITINQVPLRNVHLATLRSLTATVPQQPTLFPATVAENISYALPERSSLAIMANTRRAAKTAGIDEFIMTLPQGYNTLIGPGGTGLSGGQQQRIAIARAVARKPKFLILDEATSGLDKQTAEYVRRLVKRMQKEGCGVLAITHDRRMMQVCQDIAVMKDGRVVEMGSFEELKGRRGGELRRLLGG